MSHASRRTLLSAGVAALAGATGCLFGGDTGGTTTEPGRQYSIVVRNRITGGLLEAAGLPRDAPARIDLEAARSVQDEEDPVLFERSLEVPPESDSTLENAFRTEAGETYVVRARMERYREFEEMDPLREQLRFSPGEFNSPGDDTVDLEVFNRGREGFLIASLRYASATTSTARGVEPDP